MPCHWTCTCSIKPIDDCLIAACMAAATTCTSIDIAKSIRMEDNLRIWSAAANRPSRGMATASDRSRDILSVKQYLRALRCFQLQQHALGRPRSSFSVRWWQVTSQASLLPPSNSGRMPRRTPLKIRGGKAAAGTLLSRGPATAHQVLCAGTAAWQVGGRLAGRRRAGGLEVESVSPLGHPRLGKSFCRSGADWWGTCAAPLPCCGSLLFP